VNDLPEEINTGVYYGWAKVNNGPVYKMVMSIGWNPYFKNSKKSMVCVSCSLAEIQN
jgi:riboflavin kinase